MAQASEATLGRMKDHMVALDTIATTPEKQGRGYGTALGRIVTDVVSLLVILTDHSLRDTSFGRPTLNLAIAGYSRATSRPIQRFTTILGISLLRRSLLGIIIQRGEKSLYRLPWCVKDFVIVKTQDSPHRVQMVRTYTPPPEGEEEGVCPQPQKNP